MYPISKKALKLNEEAMQRMLTMRAQFIIWAAMGAQTKKTGSLKNISRRLQE
jgi:hypothetical protein